MDYNLLLLYLQPLLVKRPTTAERVFSIAEVSKITELLDNLNAKLIAYSVLSTAIYTVERNSKSHRWRR